MTYLREDEMYVPVKEWLLSYLQTRHKKAVVKVFDSSKQSLSRIISDNNLQAVVPPEWVSWDIQVDVVGFAVAGTDSSVALVECKLDPLTLRDLSQLIGYCRVAKPLYAFLVSPKGISDSLLSLLKTYKRIDILSYGERKGKLPLSIVLAGWSSDTKDLDWSSVVTDDQNTIGLLTL